MVIDLVEVGEIDGLALPAADGDTEGEIDAEALAAPVEGEADGDKLALGEGEKEADGDKEALGEGEKEAEGESEALKLVDAL